MADTFKLVCTCCGKKETRPAAECHEMPMCSYCLGPMILESVIVKTEEAS